MYFKRELQIANIKGSAFIFGPRMTGKTSLLETVHSDFMLNLLDPEKEVQLRGQPHLFLESLKSLKSGARVIVDEIQRVPELLDLVQIGIEKYKLNFFLSGSSARKLKRGAANLLGGRAADLRLHPLTEKEIGKFFDLDKAIQIGTLPKICTLDIEGNELERNLLLKSYVTTYIKEEIQAEAIVRNLSAFQRFLPVAAQSNAQIIEFSNISRECSVHMNTVKSYYSILEDTLLGFFLWPHDRNERKKARPKFYFFDCGVVRALQGLTGSVPSQNEKGFLFETWFINEILRIRDLTFKDHELSVWRHGEWEVDLLIKKSNKPVVAFEIKYGNHPDNLNSVNAFKHMYPKVPIYIVSATTKNARKLSSDVDFIPWRSALEIYREKF